MSEEDDQAEPVMPKVVAGAAVAAAGVRLGPEAAMALGSAGYLFESLAEKSWAELRPQARRRVAQMLATAARKLSCDDGQLGKLIGKSEPTVLMTGLAMSAAERTVWPQQVVALGRLLADGLIADSDDVDIAQFALNAMTDLSRLDVVLLELLVRHQPSRDKDGSWLAGELQPAAMYQFAEPVDWMIGGRKWREELIAAVRPELRQVLLTISGTLTRHGLAIQVDRTREALEQVTKELERQINRQAGEARRARRVSMPTLHMPLGQIQRTERMWAPTQLGEHVLDYYLEAAEQEESPGSRSDTHS
jgi:hypothetical protein